MLNYWIRLLKEFLRILIVHLIVHVCASVYIDNLIRREISSHKMQNYVRLCQLI